MHRFGHPSYIVSALLTCPLIVLTACGDTTSAPSTESRTGAAALSGLAPDEQSRFTRGGDEFIETETAAEGLGPLFNGNSCAQCHSGGGVGGPGVVTVTRNGCRVTDGRIVDPPGGSLLFLFTTRPDIASATAPPGCDVLARRRTTSVRGLGLIESIPDEDIVASTLLSKPPGVKGRAARIVDRKTGETRIGRFGWKAQHAVLDSFAADAYRNEMGVTNELFPEENAPGGRKSLLPLMDPVPDPEARQGVVAELADFMRLSAPAEPAPAGQLGERLFTDTGCASCHQPSYRTGASPIAALAHQEVRLYSDLLLHDVGTGDSISQGDAQGTEFRTAPLWGLRHNVGLLHDGRASTVDEAVRAHAGEAESVIAAYLNLPDDDRKTLCDFVAGL